MVRRLILALLTLLLAFPAAAMPACHEPAPPVPAMAAMHHSDHKSTPTRDDRHVMAEGCLGCIAPATLGAPVLAPPLSPAAPRLAAAPLTGAPLGHGPPATPPPRSVA